MDIPTESLQFLEINALWFKDKSAARQKVTDEAI
jgi:hypothetical protein